MRIASKKCVLLTMLVAVLFLVSSLQAGTTGKISGVVVDAQTNEPIPGATIQLDGTTIGAQTNIDGEYVINNIPPNTYTAKFRLVRYKTQIVTEIRVVTDKTFRLNAVLEETVIEGETQYVVAKPDEVRLDEVQNIRTIGAEQINAMPVQNVDEILSIQVGVVTRNGEIHIRGGRSGEISYIVDGVDTRG